MAYVIAEPCVGVMDQTCVDVCPVFCIYDPDDTLLAPEQRLSKLYINPCECIDCGVCADVCPMGAIFPVEELPPQWQHFTVLQAAAFDG